MAKNFKPADTEQTETAPADLLTILLNRYDVDLLATVVVDQFCERLDQAVLQRLSQVLASKPKPQIIDVPVVAGSFLEGVSYANPE